jgi:hypothetical protein
MGQNTLLGPTLSVTTILFYTFLSAKSFQYLKCLVNVFNTLWKHLKKFETNLMNIPKAM